MVSASVSFPDRLTAKGRLLRIRSGPAEVEVQETQIVGIVKDAERVVPVADLLRKYGVGQLVGSPSRGQKIDSALSATYLAP
jgi:hypothetical protein